MSLLGRKAPHVVLVQNQRSERTPRGGRTLVPFGKRVRVRCLRAPVRDWASAEEATANGLQVQDLTLVHARKWPGDVHSVVFWGGEMYETVGVPQEFSAGRRTHHWRVTVKWVGADPTPDAEVEPDPLFDQAPEATP